MKVAVVTPYHQEDASILLRCHHSVKIQTYTSVTHIFVADGNPSDLIESLENVEHMIMPFGHDDAGATPRALGAISAFSRGYDAVAFLDADNTFSPDHISRMVSLMDEKTAVVSSTRNICTEDGEIMYVDLIESNGVDFCDTNCLFIGKRILHLLTYWITDKSIRLWSDRQFWSVVKQSGATIKRSDIPTVNYHSRWAWHYQQAGRTPPAHSVWISTDQSGSLAHKKHSE